MPDDEDAARLGAWYRVEDDGSTTSLDGPPPGWRDEWADTSPPDEAYSRVTDPERYAVLHATARELLDRLITAHDVDREDGDAALDAALTEGFAVEAVVRLTPRSPGAAPLTVAFTSFPGLVVRFGDWVVRALPLCGCDACAEVPDDLAEQLTDGIEAVVAGDFTERLTGGRRHRQLHYRLGDVEADGEPSDARLDGPTHHDWAPWPGQDRR